MQHLGVGKRTRARMRFQHILQATGVREQLRPAPTEVVRHCKRVGDDHAPVLFHIGLGDDQGPLKSGLHPLAEPALQPVMEEEHGKQRGRAPSARAQRR